MKTAAQLKAEALSRIAEITPADVLNMQKRGDALTLLDVRDLHEVNLGKIPHALHISRGNLESKVEAQIPRDARVIVYCASGNRSVFAADTLRTMGYANAVSMSGGFRGWVEAGGDVE
jgi:rhodanese-related sulfurtransferase